MDQRCNIALGKSIGQYVNFGRDHIGKSIVIKRISGENSNYIDIHCRFDHPNILQGSILVPGICNIDHIILLLEPAIYNLKHFMDFETKNQIYFSRAESFSDDLIRGLSFLHSQGFSHNKITAEHCLILGSDTACLSDFKYASEITEDSKKSDNKNLGRIFLRLFTLTDSESEISRYMSVFGKKFPYQNLISGNSYFVQEEDNHEKIISLKQILPVFKSALSDMLREFKDDDPLEFIFSCIHNLHRHCRSGHKLLPDLNINNIINFTEYSYNMRNPDSDILKYVFIFDGILKPHTVYDSISDISEIDICEVIFSDDYLKIYKKNNTMEYYLGDIKDTNLYSMITNTASVLQD